MNKNATSSSKKSNKYFEQKDYECTFEDCGKHFHDKSAFRKHQLTHGEKLFICKSCGKRFLDKSKLRRHLLVHTKEKPYQCSICPKRFSLDFNLRTHLRIHTGEKPYACMYPGCFKRFSQSSNLSAHEKTHEIAKSNVFNTANGSIPNLQGYLIQKPVFITNPLQNVIFNNYSGTLHINNLVNANKLYETLKEGLQQQYQLNPSTSTSQSRSDKPHTVTNVNPNKGKLFVTIKGRQIFEIKKTDESNNKKTNNTTVYNSNNNQNYQNGYSNYQNIPKEEEYQYEEEEVIDINNTNNVVADNAQGNSNNKFDIDEEVNEDNAYFSYKVWENSFK